MAPKLVLTYFPGRGRAETTRWILLAAGAEFEDKRVAGEQWSELKPNTPTFQLPMLTVDGVNIAQSGAISCYLAAKYGLNGSNEIEAALVHMLWDSREDLLAAAIKVLFCKDPAEKEKLSKAFHETGVPRYFQILNRHLGEGKWLVGDKMTMADIAAACTLHDFSTLSDMKTELAEALKKETKISEMVERVTSIPSIKKWISERPDSTF